MLTLQKSDLNKFCKEFSDKIYSTKVYTSIRICTVCGKCEEESYGENSDSYFEAAFCLEYESIMSVHFNGFQLSRLSKYSAASKLMTQTVVSCIIVPCHAHFY